MRFSHLFLIIASSLGAIGSAHAVEYKSVGAVPAILYDAPSARGKKVFVAPRNMPVEVVFTYGDWSKVRDATGDLSWVESKMLNAKRTIVTNTPNAKIHAAPDETSPVVFTADKGVVLEMSDAGAGTAGWLKVRHSDGQTGFMKISDVWGE
jgi:SH3-like domain-containing protein